MQKLPPETTIDPVPVHLYWSSGSAYDLFASLLVLHDPDRYGLRPSWAAGVRSRISLAQRQVLEICSSAVGIPVHWLYALPSPITGTTVFQSLAQIPVPERLPLLCSSPRFTPEHIQLLYSVRQRQAWSKSDLESLKEFYLKLRIDQPRPVVLENILTAWSQADELGKAYLDALQAYYEVFFVDEERRIQPALSEGIRHAQQMALRKPLAELLESLSQGIHFRELDDVQELTLAPSFWLSPLIVFAPVSPGHRVLIFGARPLEISITPGEVVPELLLRGLKTIADPTRLRILRYLVEQPRTPTELASLLRLRAPTVTHHLSALRLAGLVGLSLGGQGDRRYAARLEAISLLTSNLDTFLKSTNLENK